MRVECPCGTLLKHTGNPSVNFADFLPSEDGDSYCEAIEAAIQEHERDIASQYVIDDTTGFFRSMCQCPVCGRLFVEDEKFQVCEFVPADPSVPRNLLGGSRRTKRST